MTEVLCVRTNSYTAVSIKYSPHVSGLMAIGCSNGAVNIMNYNDKSFKSLLQQSNTSNPQVSVVPSGILNLSTTMVLQEVVDMQFDTLSATYLLVAYQYYIVLWDVESSEQMQIFDKSNALITSIHWLSWTSGNFIVSNNKSCVVNIFNVSQKQPLETVKIVPASSTNYGVVSMSISYDSRSVLCAMNDGSFAHYNFQRHQLDYQSAAGHTETIFDCKYCPQSPDVMITGSFGTYFNML